MNNKKLDLDNFDNPDGFDGFDLKITRISDEEVQRIAQMAGGLQDGIIYIMPESRSNKMYGSDKNKNKNEDENKNENENGDKDRDEVGDETRDENENENENKSENEFDLLNKYSADLKKLAAKEKIPCKLVHAKEYKYLELKDSDIALLLLFPL